ncbi:MAG: hypothetical protein JXA54_11505 [Candidatus Heimdallarchaeota archaeon]|nr:hypothetical protein [Candidatus Heimdallarchaeota archaeon]
MEPVIIIGYIVSVVLLLLGIVLLIKSIHLKINIVVLIFVIILSAVGNLLAVTLNMLNSRIGQMLLSLGFILLYFHYESIASRKPHMFITSFLMMIFAVIVGFNVLLIIYLYSDPAIMELANQDPQNFFFNIENLVYKTAFITQYYLVSVIGLISFIRSFVVIISAYKLSKSKPALVDSIGLLFLIIYRSLFLPRIFLTAEQFMFVSSIALGCSVIGLLSILVNYVINSDFLYLLPFPIHSFMIYNNNGLLCYSRKVEQIQPEIESKDHLITGAFSAITTLIQESLGGNARIQHINAQQYQIFFNALPNESGTLVVIAYGETALFIRSLRRFIRNISSELLNSLNNITIISSIELEIDKIIQQSYPYVAFAKK